MLVKDAIEQRRAVKHYDPEHNMSDADIQELLALAEAGADGL